ncbi:hypothetical protein PF005_g1955 [Phytophthora fragariae]|uniref:Fibronectin type III-like domain-containing protein n=1 Tax=Phytophthora fragariae TaxID=53985 RepID=A0A6A3FVN3_9STRA|nr:hypothetical protein PF009_g1901 [Phytophthora fragariae]KAE9028246.1 hypothetical protein PF011_g1666 [Phytophthora fragariae]KAE9122646.1 hypothetical protein PF007_g7379 [Phytophthora fragariae]KAE9234318.1 hypothetical protein PF005_g1955 [Phytophthora fragariae]KAE9327357.1 hypothetical protein PF001_g1975 [Phytophthora fragariae]
MSEVYIGPPADAAAMYPDAKFATIALVGFANVELEAGASTISSISIHEKHLSFYNMTLHQGRVQESSSAFIR